MHLGDVFSRAVTLSNENIFLQLGSRDMSVYYLPHYVSACISNNEIIFLDAKRDNYYSFPLPASKLLAPLAETRSLDISKLTTLPEGNVFIENGILTKLIKEKMLICKQDNRKLFSSRQYHKPLSDCSNAHFTPFYPITFQYVLLFLRAFFWAILTTKILGIYQTLEITAKKRTNIRKNKPSITEGDLQEIMQIFRQIRIFFYTARNHCYFDCAVLSRFLKDSGYDAVWVFGVKTDPFEAHCWVQVNEVVMTDWQLTVDSFTPIMHI